MLKVVLTPPLELLWQLAGKLSVFIRKRKNIKFPDKSFSSKYFFRDVESSIDNPAEKIARRLMNVANCLRKKKRNILYWKKVKFCSKTCYGYAVCSFDYHVLKFFVREPKKVRWLSKVIILKKILTMILLLKILLATCWMQFWHSCEQRFDKIQFFFLQCATMIIKWFFLKKKFFNKAFLWGCGIQFWQHHRQFLEKNLEKLAKKPKNMKNYKIIIFVLSKPSSI